MAFNFPDSPTPGQRYTQGGVTYEWNGYAWDEIGVQLTIIADAAPVTDSDGQMWWDSSTGDLFIWYNDGSSSQWVQINSVGAG